MKVVLLAPTPPPAGGIAGWTDRMLKARLKDGWTVEVVDEKVIGKRQIFGKRGRRNLFEEIRRCRSIWRNLKICLKDPDVKIVQSCIPAATLAMIREYVCAIITKKRNRKFIIHFRCTVPIFVQDRMGVFILRRLCGKSDMIFSLNQQTTTYLRSLSNTPIRQIPNFISSEELIENHEIREKLRHVIYVGGIVENKGVGDCLQIASLLPDITFSFVGTGNARYEKEAKDKHLNNVFFEGVLDRQGVKEELRKSDVFLFMTFFRGEGFSNALCEAMAAGLPCVVTNWAANADMIGELGGFVVPVNGVNDAVVAIERLRDRDLRLQCSMYNIEKVKHNYIESKVLDQYVNAYNQLV